MDKFCKSVNLRYYKNRICCQNFELFDINLEKVRTKFFLEKFQQFEKYVLILIDVVKVKWKKVFTFGCLC